MINMCNRTVYAIQPYKVGSRNANSLAFVIPAKVVKRYNINTSTIFALYVDEKRSDLTIQLIKSVDIGTENMMIPAAESFQAYSQQAS